MPNKATIGDFKHLLRRTLWITLLIWFVLYVFPFPLWRYFEQGVETAYFKSINAKKRRRTHTRHYQVDLLTGHIRLEHIYSFNLGLRIWDDEGYATIAKDNPLYLEWDVKFRNDAFRNFAECRLIHFRINRLTHQITRTITKADGC